VAVARASRLRGRAGALAWQEALAAAVLAGMVALAAKLAIDAAAGPNPQLVWTLDGRGLPGWLAGPLHGLGGAPLGRDGFYAELTALCLLWGAAWALGRSIRVGWALAAAVALQLVFLLAPPIGLSDVFNYIGYGRLAIDHGLNPYLHTLQEVPTDPAFPFATWPVWTNPYGPLATLSFYPLALFTVPQALWLMKLATAAAGIACAWLAAACARRLRRPPATAVVIVALNPVLAAYGVAGAHLDLLVALALLAALWLVAEGRPLAAGAAVGSRPLGGGATVGSRPLAGGATLAAAAALKLTGGLALAFALAGARGGRRAAIAAGAAAATVTFAVIALALWGPHLLAGVEGQRGIASPRSVPGLVARALGYRNVPAGVSLSAAALFAAATLWLLWRTYRGLAWIEAAAWSTVALLLALTWLMPWYVVWLQPLAALAARSAPRAAALALTLFVVVVRWAPPLT
jgi:hypothetical protein